MVTFYKDKEYGEVTHLLDFVHYNVVDAFNISTFLMLQ